MEFEKRILELKIKKWKINTQDIQKKISNNNISEELRIKINNECDMKGWEFNDVLEKIKTDNKFASFFAKNPIKQNIAEKIQIETLKKNIPSIKKLQSTGKNAYYLYDGDIIHIKKSNVKSLDLFDITDSTYFCCKYISTNGGSQDHQFEETKNFFLESTKYIDKHKDNIKFCLIYDGTYFTEKKLNVYKSIISEKYNNRLAYFTCDRYKQNIKKELGQFFTTNYSIIFQ